MRGSTLDEIVLKLRNECGISSNSSRGNDNREYLVQLINRYYEFLCDDYDWPFLRVDKELATKNLVPGERYYDFPATMDIGDVRQAWARQGNQIWLPLAYGIGPPEYSAINSDTDQRSDPALKWQTINERQFEIWPIPNSDGNVVRFLGTRKFTRLVNSNDRCDMDDMLIVLYCAAEVLAKKSQKDADQKLSAAQRRMTQLKARTSDKRQIRIGMGTPGWPINGAGWPRIIASGQSFSSPGG